MKKEYGSLNGRNELAEDLLEELAEKKCKDVLLTGGHGSGKRFVLKRLQELIGEQKDICPLEFAGDQIVRTEKRYSTSRCEVSFDLSIYLGLSITRSRENSGKLDYIFNFLKEIKERTIVLFVPEFNICNSEIRDLTFTILKNKHFFENQLKKNITVLATAIAESRELSQYFCRISLAPYSGKDIWKYVNNVLKFPCLVEDVQYKNLTEICNSDLSLVNLIYREVLENSSDYSASLKSLVWRRLDLMKTIGEKREIPPRDLEEIILTCSLSVEYFSSLQISEMANRPEELINNTFRVSVDEKLFCEDRQNLFDFASPKVKETLEGEMITRHKTRLLDYFNYLGKVRPDEYYLRAYYLIKYEGCVSDNAFCLLVLAASKAKLFCDKGVPKEIKDLLEHYGRKEQVKQYEQIAEAFDLHKDGYYIQSNQKLKQLNLGIFGIVCRAELTRLAFKNDYLAYETDSFECRQRLLALERYISEGCLFLDAVEGARITEENILKLRIIYDIAPFVLDAMNDYEHFHELYDTSREILRQERAANTRTKMIEYINNIFNRKAFLFSNPMAAMTYYEEAKSFFQKNCLWEEYCITLVCQAGTCLACHEYKKAHELCMQAKMTSQDHGIRLHQIEKLKNNELIATFLDFEDSCVNAKSAEKMAAKIAIRLEALAGGPACGTKHVLLTNSASLYLYSGNLDGYHRVKSELEHSLACEDVSDIEDSTVNDFYRYHFAWFELFSQMQCGNWDACVKLLASLADFVPALFRKQENLWKEKNRAVQELVAQRKTLSGYEFCTKLVKNHNRSRDPARFYHRGLMVSDIQYTSMD